MARTDRLPIVAPYDLEEGEVREPLEWAGEPLAPLAEKRKETPAPTPTPGKEVAPEAALSKRTRGEGSARQDEFDGTGEAEMAQVRDPKKDFTGRLARASLSASPPEKSSLGFQSSTISMPLVPDWKPAEDFSGDEAESEARAKRPVKKPAGKQSSARPAAAGPPSTSPAPGD
ncbi:hypothetical protein H4R21_000831 [Coemansia helicoidea]|uniref:Uncharacterized protein n=2 Tax=Coemansia TaxID=4863 RepID=A0ACC1LDJ3_9FUNG|nr:hypothetical protein H4R21_000831 [Coemansia helicoidea]